MVFQAPSQLLDRMGVISAALCLAHCLVFPALALVSSAALLSDSRIHDLFVITSLISFLALLSPWRARLISSLTFVTACLGVTLLLTGFLWEGLSTIATVVGAVLLFFAHVKSLHAHSVRHKKEASCCECP